MPETAILLQLVQAHTSLQSFTDSKKVSSAVTHLAVIGEAPKGADAQLQLPLVQGAVAIQVDHLEHAHRLPPDNIL
jgi:hypothetical protein